MDVRRACSLANSVPRSCLLIHVFLVRQVFCQSSLTSSSLSTENTVYSVMITNLVLALVREIRPFVHRRLEASLLALRWRNISRI